MATAGVPWIKAARQDEIVHVLLKDGMVSVADLATHLGVSSVTVRRDLRELSASGRLERVHGSARPIQPSEPEPPVMQRQGECPDEKRAIGLAAVDLIEDGDTIAVTAGTTTLELARALAMHAWRNLTVVSNSFTIANTLMRTPGVELVFIGGRVNSKELGAFGILAEDMLKRVNIGKLFMGSRGVDLVAGLSNDEQAEIASDLSFLAASRRIILLADHTKFGRSFAITIIPVTAVHVIVTDDAVPDMVVQELRQRGIEVHVARPAAAGLRRGHSTDLPAHE